MAKKHKKDHFELSFALIVRWLVFGLLVYFAISYLSRNQVSLNVLGTQNIPVIISPQLNNTVSQLSSNPTFRSTQNTLRQLQANLPQFIDQQSKLIQKEIIKRVSDQIIKNIDHK